MTRFDKLYIQNLYLLRFLLAWFMNILFATFFLFIRFYAEIDFPVFLIPFAVGGSGIIMLLNYKFKMRKHRYRGEYVALVESLCEKYKMPVPKVYKKDIKYVGAMAFGSGPFAGLIFTDELFGFNDKKIMFGVIAHELGHIKYGHSFFLVLAMGIIAALQYALLVPFFGLSLEFAFMVVVLSLIFTFLYMYIHRVFEKQADDLAASMEETKEGLKLFLEDYKEKYQKKGIYMEKTFLLKRLMSLHPSIKERITNLS